MFILIAQISISRRLGGLGCLASARTIENFEQRLITLGLEVIVREEDRGGTGRNLYRSARHTGTGYLLPNAFFHLSCMHDTPCPHGGIEVWVYRLMPITILTPKRVRTAMV